MNVVGGRGTRGVIVESLDMIPHYALLHHVEYHVEDYEPIVIGQVTSISSIK